MTLKGQRQGRSCLLRRCPSNWLSPSVPSVSSVIVSPPSTMVFHLRIIGSKAQRKGLDGCKYSGIPSQISNPIVALNRCIAAICSLAVLSPAQRFSLDRYRAPNFFHATASSIQSSGLPSLVRRRPSTPMDA